MTTVAELRRQAASILTDAGSDTPQLDTDVLLGFVLRCRREMLLAYGERDVAGADEERFTELLHRRMQLEPIAYIVGEKEFYGRDFRTTPAVLIPRPETELLVERALERLRFLDEREELLVLDIGTGSGAIAITLDREIEARFGFRSRRVIASDTSGAALEIAAENVRRHGATVELMESDLIASLPIHSGSFALIVANLPYIPESEVLPKSVTFEPASALFSGVAGLDDIFRLLAEVIRKKPCGRGSLLLEIGRDQKLALQSRLLELGLEGSFAEDLQSIPRVCECLYREEMC